MTKPIRKAATVIDVAKEAGVAVGTVSRFLAGESLRRKNREKITNAIEKLNYKKNAAAAAMKSGRTNSIGIMVPSLSPFHADILENLSRVAQRSKMAVLTYCHEDDAVSVELGISYFLSHQIDTLVIDGNVISPDRVKYLLDSGVRVIIFDNDINGVETDKVLSNGREASRQLVEHLLNLGHKKIGILTGDLHYSNARDRLQGYKDAYADEGVDINPDYIAECDWLEHTARENTHRLMELTDPPTAIFSSNVSMTIGALVAIKEMNLSIPADISLVSFDDLQLFSVIDEGITAAKQPTDQIASSIYSIIGNKSKHTTENAGFRNIQLRCQILLRGSTKKYVTHVE